MFTNADCKKNSNRKSKLVLSTLVTAWFWNIAFHLLLIWLQTLVAMDSESRLTSFPSFCASPSEVAVLFNPNLRPFLGQVLDFDLLLCTGFDSEHVALFLCHLFTQSPITDRKIERSDRRCFGQQQLLAHSIEIFISHEKKVDSLRPEKYKALRPCWLLNWFSIARVVTCFPQESWSRPAATAADSETPCFCACPSYSRKQSRRAAPRAWPLILPSKPSELRLPSGTAFGEITRWPARAQTRTQTWTLPPDSDQLRNHSINCVEFEIFFKSVTDAKFEPSEVTFLRLMPCTATNWQILWFAQ